MAMAMDMTTTTLAQATGSTTPTSMDSMSGMASTFSINTRVTLFFTEWTTTTPATYVLTIFFLFFLGMLNRFLGAVKSQLEMRWKATPTDEDRIRATVTGTGHAGVPRGHFRKWSQALGSPHLAADHAEEIEPLSPAPIPTDDEKRPSNRHKRFWVPSAPWSIKKDGVRAFLEFIRALIGYILMLAVMTYNVGFLFAVTGSVLLGELVFGRYTQSGSGWQEGGCHE